MFRRPKRKNPLVESTVDAVLLNRYLALVMYKKFDTSRGKKYNNIVIKEKNSLQVQWKNIKNDLKGLIFNPFLLTPRIAYSLASLFFVFLGDYPKAMETAFFMGTVAFDAAAQTSHTGEPASISWSHTIGSGSNRLLVGSVSGLGEPNDPTWDSNSMEYIIGTGPTKSFYYVNPSTGSANMACDGGNIKVGGSISLEDVDQENPIGAVTSENGSSSPNDMSLTTEEDGSMRIDILGSNRDDSTEPTGSLDSGTERHNDIVPQNQFRIGLWGYTNSQATAGADTHQWTTTGFNRYYLAFEIKGVLDVPTIDGISGGFTTSQSHEVVSGTTKLIAVLANRQGTISNVQYDGNNMTLLISETTAFNETVEIWELDNPGVGTANLTATFTGGDGRVIQAINLKDTDNAATPDTADANGSSFQPAVTITTTNENCIIITGSISEGDYLAPLYGNHVELANIQSASYQNFGMSMAEKGGTGSKTLTWALNSSQRWSMVAVAIPLAGTEVEVTPSPIALEVAVPAPTVTYTYQNTATPSPVAIQVAPVALTVTNQVIVESTPDPVLIQINVPSVTATYQSLAEVNTTPIAIQISIPAVTPTYQSQNQATPSPILLNVDVPAVTASYLSENQASPSPVSLAVSLPAPTISYQSQNQVSVSPIPIEVVVPSVSPVYIAENTVFVVPLAIDITVPVVTVTSESIVAISVSPIGIVISIPAPSVSSVVEAIIANQSINVAFSKEYINASIVKTSGFNLSIQKIVGVNIGIEKQ